MSLREPWVQERGIYQPLSKQKEGWTDLEDAQIVRPGRRQFQERELREAV